ncbi:serine hydrolase domain-containing protein [Nocardia salmonicida]|uniref:serine hydrolase domain-containing protein n=1 Tax=Nocardia salmonicida TaxID=53431 RepID=UPI0007A4FAFD|nr:serine hydrolase domain-containing protein [Nocardia salmonicida]
MRQKLFRAAVVIVGTVLTATLVAAVVLVTARWRVVGDTVEAAARWSDTDVVLRVSDGEQRREWHHEGSAAGQASAPGPHSRFRIGSITKTFVATVVLQLVDEGRVALDGAIAAQLPETVPGGDRITVRQLMNHTSGLYDYMKEPGMSTNRWRGDDRFRTHAPRDLLATAVRHDPYFAPGARFRYSNTNYIALGLLIEHVTGHRYGDEIRDRILMPLRLTATTVPGDDPRVPAPALTAHRDIDGAGRMDVTEMNPSLDWAAGEMISTTADLDAFFTALLGGRLMSPASLDRMRETVPMGMGFHYGLGLQRFEPPCGADLWGHGGELLGYVSYAFRSTDGRSLTMVLGSAASSDALSLFATVTATYCLA